MIDLRRYNGLLAVALGLAAVGALLNLLLLAAFGSDPAVFSDPDRQLAWNQLKRLGSQVAGVEAQMRRRGLDNQPPFAIAIGQSTTLRGIDPDTLKEHAQPNMRWLVLNGFGSSFVKLHYYAQPLLASELRPQTVVLGLHVSMLVGQNRGNDFNSDEQASPQPAKTRSVKWNWVRRQRANVSHFTSMFLFERRLELNRWLNTGAVGLFPPTNRPWKSSARKPLPPRREDKFLLRQKNGWRDFGWYTPRAYDTANQHAEAFRNLVAGCDDLGAKRIVILLLPVTSDLRGWLPPQAQTRMQELIDQVKATHPVTVIDMQDAMPDDAFADYAHLNPAGRAVFSRMLADRLTALGADQPHEP